MAIHAKSMTAEQIKGLVCKHENFIEGITPQRKDGAASRLTMLEDNLYDIRRALNWILGILGSILAAVLIWFLTTELPIIINHVSWSVPQRVMAFFGVR